MNTSSPLPLRRVRMLLYVLFGVFMLFYTSVLKGDFLCALIMRLSGDRFLLSPWLIGSILTLLSLPLLWWFTRLFSLFFRSQPLHRWFLSFFLLLFAIGLSTDTSETETLELRTARLCAIGQYDEALKVGERFVHTSHHLLALRAFALSQLETTETVPIAEHFFAYPLPSNANSRSLRLDSSASTIAPFFSRLKAHRDSLSPRRQHQQDRHLMLLGLLLDRKLNDFARSLPPFYTRLNAPEKIPTIYREAIFLHTRLTSHPFVTFHDPNTAANYRDFLDLRQNLRQQYPGNTSSAAAARRNMMRKTYGDTYWFYYFHPTLASLR